MFLYFSVPPRTKAAAATVMIVFSATAHSSHAHTPMMLPLLSGRNAKKKRNNKKIPPRREREIRFLLFVLSPSPRVEHFPLADALRFVLFFVCFLQERCRQCDSSRFLSAILAYLRSLERGDEKVEPLLPSRHNVLNKVFSLKKKTRRAINKAVVRETDRSSPYGGVKGMQES